LLNRLLQRVARRLGYVVGLETIPGKAYEGMEGSKVDYEYLDRIAKLIKDLTVAIPQNLYEVGARFAQDACYLFRKWQLSPENVSVSEPPPDIAGKVQHHYKFVVVGKAVSDVNSLMRFNAVNLESTSNSGMAS
jgi:hypothetical protein